MRKETISAVVYRAHGNPAEVLHVESQPWPSCGPDEAVVAVHAAPVNPADLNQIEGKYPVRFEFPATPGFEGAGVVTEVGANVKTLTPGARVILPHSIGTWREACAVQADELVPVPPEMDLTQAAMLKINPLTAWRLLHGYVKLQGGEWLIQNAA
ncbi:MAG: alcohol dehydrogenase catalytic domain-containing protein, partial [Verrucomicrobiota bacterium]